MTPSCFFKESVRRVWPPLRVHTHRRSMKPFVACAELNPPASVLDLQKPLSAKSLGFERDFQEGQSHRCRLTPARVSPHSGGHGRPSSPCEARCRSRGRLGPCCCTCQRGPARSSASCAPGSTQPRCRSPECHSQVNLPRRALDWGARGLRNRTPPRGSPSPCNPEPASTRLSGGR